MCSSAFSSSTATAPPFAHFLLPSALRQLRSSNYFPFADPETSLSIRYRFSSAPSLPRYLFFTTFYLPHAEPWRLLEATTRRRRSRAFSSLRHSATSISLTTLLFFFADQRVDHSLAHELFPPCPILRLFPVLFLRSACCTNVLRSDAFTRLFRRQG